MYFSLTNLNQFFICKKWWRVHGKYRVVVCVTQRSGDPLNEIVIKQIRKSIFVNHTPVQSSLSSHPALFSFLSPSSPSSPSSGGKLCDVVTPPCPTRQTGTADGYSVILKIRYWFSANIFSLFVAFKVRFQRLVLGRFNWMLEAEEGGGEGVGMTCLHDQTRPNSLSISFISEILRRKKHTHKQHRH